MGEIADGVINGLFCAECCGIIDGEEPGYERKCEDCKPRKKRKNKGKRHGQSRS